VTNVTLQASPFVIHFRRGVWENELGAEKMTLNPSVSVFVLAGGRSSHMRGDKARLEIGHCSPGVCRARSAEKTRA
jgi:hypothetical protein